MGFHGPFNVNRGAWNSSRSREGEERPSRCCARCKTPGFGCANTVCKCHPVKAEPEVMREHLAEQDGFWRTHDRTENTPDWTDLNPEEQFTVDEDRYLLENGGVAFYDDDPKES